MADYERSGRSQVDDYEQIVKSGRPDTRVVQTEADLAKYSPHEAFLDFRENAGYRVRNDKYSYSYYKSLRNFDSSELGFDFEQAKDIMQVTVTEKGGDSGAVIAQGSYDPEGRFMVYQMAFKDENNKVADHVPLNEISMQNFIAVAGDQTKNLKAAFITDIQNKGFFAITRQNYNDLKQPFDKVLTFERGTPQFYRYMGSDNIRSTIFSFGNHHHAIGNKIIDKIIVIPKQVQGSDDELAVAIVFGDA